MSGYNIALRHRNSVTSLQWICYSFRCPSLKHRFFPLGSEKHVGYYCPCFSWLAGPASTSRFMSFSGCRKWHLRTFALLPESSSCCEQSEGSDESSSSDSGNRRAASKTDIKAHLRNSRILQRQSLEQQDTGLLDLQVVVGQSGNLVKLLLAKDPLLMNCKASEIVARISFLKSLGANPDQIFSKCPLLLAQNLATNLKLTLQCMHRIGLAKIIVGKLLIHNPNVADHLSERRFTCKVRFLECLNFSRDEIGSLLHRLSSKIEDLYAFVCMPLENLTFVAICLRRLCLTQYACRFVLQKVPHVFLYSMKELSQRIQVLEGISKDRNMVGKMIFSCPPVLLQRADFLTETVDYLNNLVQDHYVLTICLQWKASILLHRKEAIQSVLDFQYSLGVQRKMAVLVLIQQSHLIKHSSKTLQKNAGTLMTQGLHKQGVRKWFFHALILAERTEKVVKTKIKVLENQETIRVGSKKLQLPLSVLKGLKGSSKNRINRSLDFLFRPGLDKEFPKMIEAVNKLHMQLVGAGIPKDKVYKMISNFPPLLAMTEKDIKKKMDFLVSTMQRPIKDVEDCPAFFACDLESQMKPRHRLLQWLRTTGVLEKDPPLSTVVHMSSDWFIYLFVECHPQGLVIYKGDSNDSSASEDGKSS